MSDPSKPYTADAQVAPDAGAVETAEAPAAPSPSVADPVGLRPLVVYLARESDPHALDARVMEPAPDSKQAVRGCLYAVVEFSGGAPRPDVSERLLSLLQRTYYTAKGSQAHVLGEAVRSALGVVREFNAANPNAPLRVSIACASLLQHRLMLACSGAAFALLRAGEHIELYPNQPERALPLQPAAEPHVEVLKWEMAPGDAALLCGPGWSDRLPVKTLAGTVYYVTTAEAEAAAQGLREQAGGVVAAGLLLVMEPAPPPPAPRPVTPLTAPRRAAPVGLPTALAAPPPISAPAPFTPPPLAPVAADVSAEAPSVPAFLRRSELAAGLSLEPPPAASATAAAVPQHFEPFPAPQVQPAAHVAAAAHAPVADQEEPAAAALPGPSPADRLVTGARESVDRARHFLRQMLPEKRTPNPADFEPMDEAAPPASPAPAAAASATALPAAPALAPTMPAPERIKIEPFTPPAPASGGRARLFITLALLVALLVPVTVAAYYWRLGAVNRAEAETLVSLADSRIGTAQDALNNGDARTALDLASEAQDYIDRSEELVGPTQTSSDLGAEVRRIQQESSNTKMLYALTSPLITFPSGAAPTRVFVNDQDIYILDPGRGVVERYRLDDTQEVLADPNGTPVLKTGQSLDGATVGPLLDMAWQPIVPGYDDKATLLVLDANNQIFRYDPRVEGPSRLDMGGAANFKALRQIETFNRRLYVADAGQKQVLRYPEGQYDAEPANWFTAPVNLDEMQSMRIDGDLWIMLKNGQILRYFSGEQVPFALDSSVGLVREAVDFAIGDGTNPFIYVADRGGERIWVFDHDGKYVKQFAAPEGNPLRGLSGIFIEDVTDSLFLLTPAALYKHPLVTD